MFLDKWAAFGSLEEDDLSVPVFCLLILPVIMALSFFKDKVLMKMITDRLPSLEQKNKDAMKRNDKAMMRLEKAIQQFDSL